MVGLARVQLYEDDGDLSEAFGLFKKAAEQNNPEGLYYTGYCYLYGYGTEKSVDSAYYHLAKAKELGYSDAERLLNTISSRGHDEDA